jgi:Mrp family chromosome partitioning ATPase
VSRHSQIFNETTAKLAPIPEHGGNVSGANGSSIKHSQRETADEQISHLVQRIFLTVAGTEQPKVVVFCGVDRGAGCSWVCARAAEILATQTPGRVCVVDANFRSPSMHSYFHAEPGPGLAQALKQPEPIQYFVRSTWSNHLWLLTAGTSSQANGSALEIDGMRARFAELREEFDFLLVDVDAITGSDSAVIAGQFSDGVVVVIASNSTRRDAARVAKQTLDEAKVPVLGAVLNKRTYPMPEAVYRRL